MGTDGTATPSDQSATSGWVNSGAGVFHSPWNSSFPTPAFSAAACSSFSIYKRNPCINEYRRMTNVLTATSVHSARWTESVIPLQGPCRSTNLAWPPMGAPWRWFPSSWEPPGPTSTTSDPQSGDPERQNLGQFQTCQGYILFKKP